jgi:Glyoxalase-like domain
MHVDHLVWYCSDLAQGESYFAERTGCSSAYGGIHPGEGTANRLLSLSETTYVEILGRDIAQQESSLAPEVRGLVGHGLYHWAIGGVDIAGIRTRAIAAGLIGSDLVAGGRTLPNGNWLGWTCFGIHNHEFGAMVPFFIDWMESEHPAKTAPRGGRLHAIEAFSPQAQKLRDLYQVLGIDVPVLEAQASGLSVTLASAKGSTILQMFDPVPQGYVI